MYLILFCVSIWQLLFCLETKNKFAVTWGQVKSPRRNVWEKWVKQNVRWRMWSNCSAFVRITQCSIFLTRRLKKWKHVRDVRDVEVLRMWGSDGFELGEFDEGTGVCTERLFLKKVCKRRWNCFIVHWLVSSKSNSLKCFVASVENSWRLLCATQWFLCEWLKFCVLLIMYVNVHTWNEYFWRHCNSPSIVRRCVANSVHYWFVLFFSARFGLPRAYCNHHQSVCVCVHVEFQEGEVNMVKISQDHFQAKNDSGKFSVCWVYPPPPPNTCPHGLAQLNQIFNIFWNGLKIFRVNFCHWPTELA